MGIWGQDWSSYQSATPPTNGLSFAFVKITEGLSYTNPEWVSQRNTAKTDGLVFGGYHYPHMGNSVAAEADFFLGKVTWQSGDLICLDWEGYDAANQGVPRAQQAAYKDAWLHYVKGKMPHFRVGMYCDVDYWRNVDTSGYYGDFLWIATAGLPAGQPGITAPWLFHQYSANGTDHDYCHLASLADLRTWATVTGTPVITPPGNPNPPTTSSPEDDMPKWDDKPLTPSATPTTVLPPHGAAWSANPNRRLHLGMDSLTDPKASAVVRVALHDGNGWAPAQPITVTADGPTVDVPLTNQIEKVSLQTLASGVSYSVETW